MLDPLMQQKAVMLRGAAMAAYFERFLTPMHAQFMNEMLKTRAGVCREAFVPLTTSLRKSLGPCDAFMRETRRLEGTLDEEDSGTPAATPPARRPEEGSDYLHAVNQASLEA